jgi:site-specific DNA-methyltransferase (adenine-specific)
MIDLQHGDCLELMKSIPDGSIDMILCDLPYGTTQNKWDSIIPLDEMWEQYKRITKPTSAICLFSQMPFTAQLVMSNPKMFRYEWVLEKANATGFLNAKKMPMKAHETVIVFYDKLPIYNPIMEKGKPYMRGSDISKGNKNYGGYVKEKKLCTGGRYPRDVLKTVWRRVGEKTLHPTQKPVSICEYFIKTYSHDGDIVLDNCMGSGSTGVACLNTNRNFIGMEKDDKYFEIACERIKNHERW